MGRRALPKLDPKLDLSQCYQDLESLAEDWQAAGIAGRVAPLEIEIGSGKGLFLASAGKQRPEHSFLGIEIARKYARHAAARCARQGLSNVLVLGGDARVLLETRLAVDSVFAAHIYFPDPWWKKRHHKRRIMSTEFLLKLHHVLQPGGQLHFWTDVEEYFVAALATLKETTPYHGPFEVPELQPEHDLDYRTHFERRMRQHGLPVFRAEFVK